MTGTNSHDVKRFLENLSYMVREDSDTIQIMDWIEVGKFKVPVWIGKPVLTSEIEALKGDQPCP
jgi:hypothetical protein